MPKKEREFIITYEMLDDYYRLLKKSCSSESIINFAKYLRDSYIQDEFLTTLKSAFKKFGYSNLEFFKGFLLEVQTINYLLREVQIEPEVSSFIDLVDYILRVLKSKK